VVIIGTAHVSSQSAKEAEELIQSLEPDSIVLELSEDRIGSLHPAPPDGTAMPLKLHVSKTRKGFLQVLKQEQLPQTSEYAGKIMVAGPEPGKVSEVQMRPALTGTCATRGDEEWLKTALKKHRYVSSNYEIRPGLEFLVTLFQSLVPRAQRSLYVSIFTVKQSGLEFASAARCARQLDCPLILADVDDEDLFDPLKAIDLTRSSSVLERLAGPMVRPSETSGIDFGKALTHVFGEFSWSKVLPYLPSIWFGLWCFACVYDGYLDESKRPELAPLWIAVPSLATPWLVASCMAFLLTAARDAQLFDALAEAAEEATRKRGRGGRVVLVCGLAHVNGIARRVANWEAPA